MAVVLCRPIGFEGTCAYETYTQLAEKLARAGFAVIRFDYHGTGDSPGSDTDPNRVPAWIESIQSALDEGKRLGGVSRMALFGVRLGATLAATAATQWGGVECLLMWAPCVTGRAFGRELRVSGSRLAAAGDVGLDEGLEALGYVYTAQTLQDLQTLDCQRLPVAPAKRVLLVGRDDLPIEGPLPASYRAMGMDTTYLVLPGYADMVVEPHESAVAHDSLDAMVAWLQRACAAATPGTSPVQPMRGACARARAPFDSVVDAVRESALWFGAQHQLFGILAEPAQLSATDLRWETAVLLLNVGTNYRIGPNRLYVKMARSWAAQGYRTLRFDFAGIGDSRSETTFTSASLYSKESTVDVQAAIDGLAQRGCKRFIVMGICSGAYVAFQASLVEPRVTELILLNPRRLDWTQGETLQSAMQVSYKSTHFYKKALLDPDVYRRLLRGQVDVRGIAGRMGLLMAARLKRLALRFSQSQPGEQDVLANAKRLSSRGQNLLLIMGAEDDGRDYIEFHFGVRGKHMASDPGFEMAILEGVDHTFSNAYSQQTVVALIGQHLDRGQSANV
jgi:alpha-beta hydrolase superfamily lysophospholipase